jgi:hypothetical protein
MEELEIYQEVYKVAKPVVDSLISTIIKPKLEKLGKWLKRNEGKIEVENHFWESKFEEYLLRTYQNTYFINTIVFPNQQIKLRDIYYPVKLVNSRDNRAIVSSEINEAFFQENNRILVSDYAGMGKSTLSKFLTSHIIDKQIGIPIFIELKRLGKENPILTEIYSQLNPIDDNFNQDFIIRLLKRGDFVVILDGFDEVSVANQETVITDIRQFISRASKNNFVMTSRPEAILASFGEFQEFYIKPLEIEESYEIIDKLNILSPVKIAKMLRIDIDKRLDSVRGFLRNPFLVSLLFKSYTYNKDIPSKKSTFYDEVYTAFYKAHDLSKDGYKREKASKLDIQDFRTILRELAFASSKLRIVEYSKQELIESINSAKKRCPDLNFKAIDFFDDLILSVPLIVKDGSKYKWAHKSIQDYFSAEFICFHSQKEEICNKIYSTQNESFLNVLLLLQELEQKLFKKTILLKLLNDFINHYNNSFSDFKMSNLLQFRKIISFGITTCFLKISEEVDLKDNSGKEFDYARELTQKKYQELSSMSFATTLTYGENTFVLFGRNIQRLLTEMLYLNTKYDIFLKELKKPDELFRVKNFPELPNLDEAFKADEDKKNILNNKSNFQSVTDQIYRHICKRRTREDKRRNIPIALDIAKCKKLIDSINQESFQDNSFNVLDGI